MIRTFEISSKYEIMGVFDKSGDGTEFAVLGREFFGDEEYWCTWLGFKNGLEQGHYMMSKENAIKDWLER